MPRAAGWVLALAVAVSAASAASAWADEGGVAFRFADPAIVESSGLVLQDGVVLTVNDSGNDAVLFSVDPSSGRTVAVTRFAESQVDVEALAPAGGTEVWVGDIGDNQGERSSIGVTRVAVDGSSDPAGATTVELVYPDGRGRDAETLLCDPRGGGLYVVTKSLAGGVVYRAPRVLDPTGPNRLTEVGDVAALLTDGAFLPDGRHVILRGYGHAWVYTFPGFELVADVGLPSQPQGEGIAVDGDGALFLSTEGALSPVLRVTLPASVRDVLAPSAAPSDRPSDAAASSSGDADPASGPVATPRPAAVDGSGRWWLVAGAGALAAAGLAAVVVRRRRG